MNGTELPEPPSTTVHLLIGPLRRHEPLRRFFALLSTLPGVVSVVPGRFRGEGVEVDVTCSGSTPLAACLEALTELRLQVASERAGALLRVRLLSELDEDAE